MDGQGTQILQQVGDLLAQLAQQETEPTIQRAIMSIMKQMDPLMQLVGQDDQQDMSSGLATPNGPGAGSPMGGAGLGLGGAGPAGPMPPGGPPVPGSPMPGGPPDLGGGMSSEGPASGPGGPAEEPTPKTFAGAKKAAMANHAEKGHFSKSGSKGENLRSDKQKNRK